MAEESDSGPSYSPRYVACLRDAIDASCYKDFFEADTFEEAQKEADFAAEKHKRNTIVYDRKPFGGVIYRKIVQEENNVVVVTPPIKQKQTKRKKKEPKPVENAKTDVKVVDKDAYFD